jgi:4-hydroxybenzoate polyprenyltransferase
MNGLQALVVSMRPRQYTKNLLVFAAPIFARKLGDPVVVVTAVVTFVLFCLLSSAVYLMNDIIDAPEDRRHPEKRKRPIASGTLAPSTAALFALVLAAIGLAGCFTINVALGSVALGYLGLQALYQVALKRMVILDVLAIAVGFVLRAVAGGEAIGVVISEWLLICTLLLALFLGLAKRRGELALLEESASSHRKTLEKYSLSLLDQMIAVVTASTLMSYCLYTISPRTVEELGSTRLMYTVPFVIYGIFRYLFLMHRRGEGGHPERTLLSDKPLLINVALYVLAAAVIIYGRTARPRT